MIDIERLTLNLQSCRNMTQTEAMNYMCAEYGSERLPLIMFILKIVKFGL